MINWDIARKKQWPKAEPFKWTLETNDIVLTLLIHWSYDHDEDGINVYLEKALYKDKDAIHLLKDTDINKIKEQCDDYVEQNFKSDDEIRSEHGDYLYEQQRDED